MPEKRGRLSENQYKTQTATNSFNTSGFQRDAKQRSRVTRKKEPNSLIFQIKAEFHLPHFDLFVRKNQL